jgi:hypothetical protein
LFNDRVFHPVTKASSPSPGSSQLTLATPSQSLLTFNAEMEGTYNLMRDFIKLMRCSWRKSETASSVRRSATTRLKNKKVSKPEANHDSDFTSRSTETGDTSNNEFSDNSNYTDGGRGNSGFVRPPPGLDAPLGLSAPPGLECRWEPQQAPGFNADAKCFVPTTTSRPETGLNAGAASFIPKNSFGAGALVLHSALGSLEQGLKPEYPENSQELRHSIKMLKGCLEDWEANLPSTRAPPAPPPQDCLGPAESHSLLEALAKLTPKEAATVRSMLDQKLSSHNVPSTGSVLQAMQRTGFSNMAPWNPPWSMPQQRMQRPFTPFQRDRVSWEKPAKPGKAPQTDDSGESLRTQLKDLAEIDNARVLMVRKINRLGLDSAPPLKDYFSKFGGVDRVLVAPTRAKAQFGQTRNVTARVRAAPLGFVVMSTVDEAIAALAAGSEQIVSGQAIGVYPFQSHDIDEEKK